MVRFFLLCLALCLGLSGCASYSVDSTLNPETIPQRKKIWVKRNFDDNQFMSVRVVEALRLRGYEVDSGPMTLMPKGTELVIEYRDNWAWDFKYHLVGLELKFLEPKSMALITVARYSHPASVFTESSAAVDQLIQEIYEPRRKSKPVKS